MHNALHIRDTITGMVAVGVAYAENPESVTLALERLFDTGLVVLVFVAWHVYRNAFEGKRAEATSYLCRGCGFETSSAYMVSAITELDGRCPDCATPAML